MIFGQEKDILDIKNILTVQKEKIDRKYVGTWIEKETSDVTKVMMWENICASVDNSM